ETVALEVGAANLFEILEDAALQLEHVRDAHLPHVEGRLLAPDSAGAETHDRLALQIGPVLRDGLRKLSELLDPPVESVGEGAVADLEGVARVEHDHVTTLIVVPAVEPSAQGGGVDRRCPT